LEQKGIANKNLHSRIISCKYPQRLQPRCDVLCAERSLPRRGNGLPACRSASQAETIQRDTATISRFAYETRADPSSGPIGGGRIFFEEGSRENLDVGCPKQVTCDRWVAKSTAPPAHVLQQAPTGDPFMRQSPRFVSKNSIRLHELFA